MRDLSHLAHMPGAQRLRRDFDTHQQQVCSHSPIALSLPVELIKKNLQERIESGSHNTHETLIMYGMIYVLMSKLNSCSNSTAPAVHDITLKQLWQHLAARQTFVMTLSELWNPSAPNALEAWFEVHSVQLCAFAAPSQPHTDTHPQPGRRGCVSVWGRAGRMNVAPASLGIAACSRPEEYGDTAK